MFPLTHSVCWLSALFLPLVIAGAFIVPRWRTLLTFLSPWSALPALFIAVFVQTGSSVRIPGVLLEAQFGLDATAKVFLLFTALIWLIAGRYAYFYFPDGDQKYRFFIYYLVAMCGNLGLILAQDVMSFYVLFALMSFSSYGLVVHSGTKPAYRAGKVYICLVVLGEAFVFSSLLMAAHVAGSLYFSDFSPMIAASPMRHMIIGMALLGFGIKAGALPLHVWLPLAHPVAPTPASAILSAAMIKAGLLGWLRVLPLGDASFTEWGIIVLAAGFLAAFYGAFVGITQSHAKTVLAYSSISQMGLMTVLIGIGFLYPETWGYCWSVLMFYAAHHAFAKGALFLSVGTASTKIRHSFLNGLRMMGVFIPVAAIIGLPYTSGALAKMSLKYVLSDVFGSTPEGYMLKGLLSVATIGTILILSRFLWLVMPRAKQKEQAIVSVKVGVYLSWGLLVACVVALPLLIPKQNFIQLPAEGSFDYWTWNNLWPFCLGGLMVWMVIARSWRNPFLIPEGDILVMYMKIISMSQGIFLNFTQWIVQRKNSFYVFVGRLVDGIVSYFTQGDRFIRQFEAWRAFGVSLLTLFLTFYLFLIAAH